jgi:hypothetical protein
MTCSGYQLYPFSTRFLSGMAWMISRCSFRSSARSCCTSSRKWVRDFCCSSVKYSSLGGGKYGNAKGHQKVQGDAGSSAQEGPKPFGADAGAGYAPSAPGRIWPGCKRKLTSAGLPEIRYQIARREGTFIQFPPTQPIEEGLHVSGIHPPPVVHFPKRGGRHFQGPVKVKVLLLRR